MRRLWLVLVWFLVLVLWSLPPGWSATSNSDKPRLFIAALGTMETPTIFLLTVAVIILIFTVRFRFRAPY